MVTQKQALQELRSSSDFSEEGKDAHMWNGASREASDIFKAYLGTSVKLDIFVCLYLL